MLLSPFSPFSRFGWDPFAEMRQLQAEMNRLFEDFAPDVVETPEASAYPPVNVWVGETSVAVTAELPGLTRDDIELTIREDTLTIKGERKPHVNDDRVVWHRRERGVGPFVRTIMLPFRVDPDQAEARFANGILEVEMQRPKADQPKKIQISTK